MHPESPATGHLDTRFLGFPVFKQMLRWFSSLNLLLCAQSSRLEFIKIKSLCSRSHQKKSWNYNSTSIQKIRIPRPLHWATASKYSNVFTFNLICDSPNLLQFSMDALVLFSYFGRVTVYWRDRFISMLGLAFRIWTENNCLVFLTFGLDDRVGTRSPRIGDWFMLISWGIWLVKSANWRWILVREGERRLKSLWKVEATLQ
jgi:hypothetical protein